MGAVGFEPQISGQNIKSQNVKNISKTNTNSAAEFSKALKSVFSSQQLSEVAQAQAGVETDLKKRKILTGKEKDELKTEDESLFALMGKIERKLDQIKREEKKLRS